jgi:hypothetical protein
METPGQDPATPHGACIDHCFTCHCMGIFNGMRVGGGSSEADVFARWLLHDQPAKFEDQPIV